MPLYRVTFTESQGYRVTCRIRAAALADHISLAIQKVWGEGATLEDGRIVTSDGIPRTRPLTVHVAPVAHAQKS